LSYAPEPARSRNHRQEREGRRGSNARVIGGATVRRVSEMQCAGSSLLY